MAYRVKVKTRDADPAKTDQLRTMIGDLIKVHVGKDGSGATPGKYTVGVFSDKAGARKFRWAARALVETANPTDDFISEDDLLTFEGFLKYQAVPTSSTPEELKMWRGLFDEATRLRETSPKVGLMKLPPVPGEQKYAVAIRDGSDLWLTLWVRCSRKGEIFIMYPGGNRRGNAHASYHLDGTFHQKSHGATLLPLKRQPLTAAFRGSEHLGMYGGHGTSTGAVCDPKAFDGVVIVEPGIFGPRDGSVGIDLVDPGVWAKWNRGMGQSLYLRGAYQREVFRRKGRPSVVITISR